MPEPFTAEEFRRILPDMQTDEGYAHSLNTIQSLIAAHRLDATRAAYVKAAKSICSSCSGKTVTTHPVDKRYGHWGHQHIGSAHWYDCKASDIHDLIIRLGPEVKDGG